MNQEFFETTLGPFIEAFLDDFHKEYKKNDKGFEEFYEIYFSEDSTNKNRLSNLVTDLSTLVNGNNNPLYAGVSSPEIVDTIIPLIKSFQLKYQTNEEFYHAFFSEDESNIERVSTNRRLLAMHFDNQTLSLLSAQGARTCTPAEISRFKSLMVKVLGEERFKSLEKDVFIGDGKMIISNSLQTELISGFQALIESQVQNNEITAVDFSMRDLKLEAEIETDDGTRSIEANGEDEIDIDIEKGDQALKLKGMKVDFKTKLTKKPKKPKAKKEEPKKPEPLKQAKPKRPEDEIPEEPEEVTEISRLRKARSPKREDAKLPGVTKLPPAGVTPNTGTPKIPTKKRPKTRFKGTQKVEPITVQRPGEKPVKRSANVLAQKFAAHQKARRFTQKQNLQPDKNPRDPRNKQPLDNFQLAGTQTDQEKGGIPLLPIRRRGKAKKTMRNAVLAAAGISVPPVFGGSAIMGAFISTPQNVDPTLITATFDAFEGVHSFLIQIVHFIV